MVQYSPERVPRISSEVGNSCLLIESSNGKKATAFEATCSLDELDVDGLFMAALGTECRNFAAALVCPSLLHVSPCLAIGSRVC